MSKQETKDRIVQILEEIVGKAHYINNHPEKELCLELDLIMEDLRSLYREYSALKNDCLQQHVHAASGKGQAQAAAEEREEEMRAREAREREFREIHEKEAREKEAQESRAREIREKEAREKEAQESRAREIREKEARETEMRPPISQSPPLPEQNLPKVPGTARRGVGEKFPADNNSLHERISGLSEDRSIGARMQQNPISNIKDAIGVNEKFLFINELFNGNIQAYHEAIATLNSMDSVRTAFDYLNQLNESYQWDAERSAATIEKLANFVQRRYMS
jgi:phage-related minor tail protein